MNPEFAVSGAGVFSSSMNPEFAVAAGDDERKSLDELIASWKAQPDLHFHSFSSEELMKATDYFNPSQMVGHVGYAVFYRGFIGNQPILIKKLRFDSCGLWPSEGVDYVNIRATVIAAHLSSLGSSLKFVGSCHQLSAQVFEYQGNVKFLSDGLYQRNGTLPWRNRLSVAQDIANALAILHNSFATPVILRDLQPRLIVLDEFGAAKLLHFSLCIQIPVGESQVEDLGVGSEFCVRYTYR